MAKSWSDMSLPEQVLLVLKNRNKHLIDVSPLGLTQEQFMRRVDKVFADRDMASVVIANEVTDILNTRGGKAGRFKW